MDATYGFGVEGGDRTEDGNMGIGRCERVAGGGCRGVGSLCCAVM